MHVMFVIGGLGSGGSERQMLQLIEAIHGDQHEVTLVTQSNYAVSTEVERVRALKLRWVELTPPSVPRALRPAIVVPRMVRVIGDLTPDVVYPWLEQSSAAAIPAALIKRVPVVVARRNVSGAAIERWWPIRLAIRRLERLAPVVTANSLAAVRAAESRGIRPDRLRLVRNGHRPVAPLPPPSGSPVRLGYLANFRPEKGHARLMAALSRLEARVAWECVLGGEGPLIDAMKAEVRSRGLSERVRFVGAVSDPRAFWQQCDVAVLLSDHEGSPNALIEAAYAGRPMVATAVGGTPEIVASETGFLSAPGDAQSVVVALQRLIDHPDLRAHMGRQAHRHVSGLHDLNGFVEGHLGALAEAARR